MKKNSKSGQVWSIDLVIGLLVFILILTVFYLLLVGNKESKAKNFADKADNIADKFYEEGLVDPITGEFNRERFLELANEDYDDLRERLGIVGEFCIYIENNADPAQILFITNETGYGFTGIGSDDLNISGFTCGTTWP